MLTNPVDIDGVRWTILDSTVANQTSIWTMLRYWRSIVLHRACPEITNHDHQLLLAIAMARPHRQRTNRREPSISNARHTVYKASRLDLPLGYRIFLVFYLLGTSIWPALIFSMIVCGFWPSTLQPTD